MDKEILVFGGNAFRFVLWCLQIHFPCVLLVFSSSDLLGNYEFIFCMIVFCINPNVEHKTIVMEFCVNYSLLCGKKSLMHWSV